MAQLRALIAQGRKEAFYSWPEWKSLRPEVLRLDNSECQRCKARGKYRPARIVHHVKHLEDRPDLALSVWDPDTDNWSACVSYATRSSTRRVNGNFGASERH